MVRLTVHGMTCEHCVRRVRDALAAVPGVRGEADISLERGEATVEGDADADALMGAVRAAGYDGDVLK